MNDLFGQPNNDTPLAALLRPTSLDDYLGQTHIVGADAPLGRQLRNGRLHSLIFWGPPGVGKTSLARVIANHLDLDFYELSAVLSGTKEIRELIEQCRFSRQRQKSAIVFIDEIHRFNKSQQDAFLPHVEEGLFTLIGATTENPSFEVNNALMSRTKVYKLKPLSAAELGVLIQRGADHLKIGTHINDTLRSQLVAAADGDGRRALTLLEDLVSAYGEGAASITADQLGSILGGSSLRFDKKGDYFYDQISALHKSIRGSSPDGALYWLARMINSGADALYIARRLVRMASEDIGNADPRALQVAINAWEAQERLGSPEGELALAQAATYLACAPKSNAVYTAWKQALNLASHNHEVPNHLRNAPTKLMAELGYSEGYRYAHDEPEAYAAGEQYLPTELYGTSLYHPVERGLEQKISQKLRHLKQLDESSSRKRDKY